MPLLGLVEHGPATIGEGQAFPRHGQSDERGLGPAAGEQPARLRWVAEKLLEPIEHQQLDLGRPGRFQPDATEEVARCAQPIRKDRHEGGCSRNERGEARMVGAKGERRHLRLEFVQNPRKVLALLRRRLPK